LSPLSLTSLARYFLIALYTAICHCVSEKFISLPSSLDHRRLWLSLLFVAAAAAAGEHTHAHERGREKERERERRCMAGVNAE
jgi:hypothetical protein